MRARSAEAVWKAEIVRKAQWLTRAGAAVEKYSTRFENPFDSCEFDHAGRSIHVEDQDIPYGLGCGGVLDVLLEPACTAGNRSDAAGAWRRRRAGETFYRRRSFPRSDESGLHFARVILREDGSVFFASENADPAVKAQIDAAGQPGFRFCFHGRRTRAACLWNPFCRRKGW